MTHSKTLTGMAIAFGASVSILAISPVSPAHAAEQFECQSERGAITWLPNGCPSEQRTRRRRQVASPLPVVPPPPGEPPKVWRERVFGIIDGGGAEGGGGGGDGDGGGGGGSR